MSVQIFTTNESDKLQALFDEKKTFFLYCHGSYDENTGSSWCSDCDKTRPVIEEQLKKLNGNEKALFVKLPVDTKQEWSNQQHLYRTHKKLMMKGVPTLVFYSQGEEFGRFVELDIMDKDVINDFFDTCIETINSN